MVFLSGFVRFLGAFQAGVAVYVMPQTSQHPFGVAVAIAVIVFLVNWSLEQSVSPRELILRGYVAPLAVVSTLHVFSTEPESWHEARQLVQHLIVKVFSLTPSWMYLVGAAFGGYRAHVAAESRSFAPPNGP